MDKSKKLSYKRLKKMYNPDNFPFSSTEELASAKEIIGQSRAEKAMEFGLRVKNSKYNIFIVGLKGTGKKSYAKKIAEKNAKTENIPDDWCYVYNFDEPSRPIALNMPPGMGKIFCDDMDELIKELLEVVPKKFSDEIYEQYKGKIIKKYQKERNILLEQLTAYCLENGFDIKNTNKGFALSPRINGKAIGDEEYEMLDEEQKKQIEQKAEDVEKKAVALLRKIKHIEHKAKIKMGQLDDEVGRCTVKPFVDVLFDKYKDHEKVIKYLKTVQENIVENIYDFDASEEEQDETVEDSFLKKYKVNLFVDNSNNIGAPVIIEYNPSYQNLVGKIEYENEQGSLKTDFTMIKAGAMHKANGGYLILQANQILSNIKSWDALKRVVETGQLCIESLRTQLGIVDIVSLKPEAINIHLKVILVGNPYIYNMLYAYDENFEKLFKIKVDFDSVMDGNEENGLKMAQFIRFFCEKEKLKHLDASGVAKILEYSHRIAGSQKKLTTRFNKLVEILIEADVWAEIDQSLLIAERHVKKAYVEKIYRNNKIEQKIEEMYKKGKILFHTKGKKIGSIHGLSVIDLGDYIFGKPSAISVTTFVGNKGIVNIEREAKLSGSIHDKGVMILEGYLSEKFAQEYPLTLTAKICFEQNYSGVDGDSASSTELYALLSSLSDTPINQNIAVTGSVNQKGEIQPIGGVSEKIEGFFSLCNYYGLTGEQGVIIPHQNIEDLVLCDDVIDAVKEEKFHIYPISKIEEGMEILTDTSFDEICEAVKNKLDQYMITVKNEIRNKGSKMFKRNR
ncbi:Lon protease family protein [Marinisporobacter balticus]|uniref:endopeptidase La n=1 Tax=Marinisporobacter balticus TaxID=2018667 RepID=A0A4R2LJG6_9FIRM|nr:ATP-binding protein [Marinisporobacter balticus]TCO79515.1 lon-related putative ATP-dependent protease [Marinisporobacter balticus]